MRMTAFFLTLILISLSVGQIQSADAQDFRRMNNAEIERFADHTFWRTHKLDRFYFNSNKTFIQQLNDSWEGVSDGTMLKGTWSIKNDNICWIYDEETDAKFNTGTNEFCYSIMTNSPADNFMTTHMETFRLFDANDTTSWNPAFEWNRYAYDNYILDPEYVPMIQEGLKQMGQYRRNGSIPFGTIKREELTDPWMQEYYDETVNRIFFIADQSMFFNDQGLFFFINERGINEANGDVDAMISTGAKGRWQMKDNIHCWFLSENRSSCEFVMPEGKGLIRPYNGFFGVFYTGFTRVHGEMATGHIDPADTSAPALFNRLMTQAP
jgi:hypothetical protein